MEDQSELYETLMVSWSMNDELLIEVSNFYFVSSTNIHNSSVFASFGLEVFFLLAKILS